MGCGNKREGRQNNLSCHIKCSDGNFKTDRCIAYGNTMLNPNQFRNLMLQFLNKRTVVRQPTSVEHVVDTREEVFAIGYVGATHMPHFFKCRIAPKNR